MKAHRHRPLPDERPEVAFTFEGRTLTARRGQSIAAALLSHDIDILTRSFKYRRPRGYTCGFDACGNCPLTVNGLPGVSSCITLVSGGEQVRRERGWPSTDLDVFRVADLLSRFLGAGFQFRYFARHPRLGHHWERVLAAVAGAGRLPSMTAASAARASAVRRETPDVLVVGGGLSGCAATLGAASAGARVVLAQRGPLGGRSRARVDPVQTLDGRELPARDVAGLLAAEIRSHPKITVLTGTAVAAFEDGTVPVTAGAVRHDLQPRRIVVATGSYDIPALFEGNDLPGVMLAGAVRRLLHVERVRPGRSAVIITDRADGHRLAAELTATGVQVRAIIQPPTATVGDGTLQEARSAERVVHGRITRAIGRRRLRAVEVRSGGASRHFACDLLCVALGERPAEELVLQLQYLDAGTTTAVEENWRPRQQFSGRLNASTWVVGSAAGGSREDLLAAHHVGQQAGAGAMPDDSELRHRGIPSPNVRKGHET